MNQNVNGLENYITEQVVFSQTFLNSHQAQEITLNHDIHASFIAHDARRK